MSIICEIVTQERTLMSKEVDSINLQGSEGRMGILPNHSPMLTTLTFGEVIVRSGGQEEYIAVGGGFAEIQPTKVIILADSAEYAEEIDIEAAERAMAQAKQAMEEGVHDDADQWAQIEASLRQAQLRAEVGRRRAGRRRASDSMSSFGEGQS